MKVLNDFENAIKQDLEGKTLFVMVTSVSADKGLRIRGCGMDMTFALVNDLNHTLGLSLKREIL